MKGNYIVGIDEVGRGPLAGPVAVCAFKIGVLSLKIEVRSIEKKLGIKLKDSKKLSERQREAWFAEIKKWQKANVCDFTVSMASAKQIDKIGISKAIQKCLASAISVLRISISDLILLDGGLYAPIEFKNQKTIIKGDEKKEVIALASIVAKVTRDRLMGRLAKKYKGYGFEIHKGYGTQKHYIAIETQGISPIHRKTFLKSLI